ncbi:hypothetical protein [Novosphingobium olei]|nr:hypothetical protein [Novosphingobium olei]
MKQDAFVAFLDFRKLFETEILGALYQLEQMGKSQSVKAQCPLMPQAEIALGPCRRCGGEPLPGFYEGLIKSGFVVECATDRASGDGSHATVVHSTVSDASREWNGLA